ncbi:MAG: IclR family transcriptional regulator C-terminal domain-containing protein, partial [Actinomycetota bacterium]
AAKPLLQELADELGEAAGFAVLDHGEVRYLEQTESDEEIQVRSWIGESVPLHLVPSGLILMADLPAPMVDDYLAGPLPATTDRSVVDPAAIRARLVKARNDGHVWVHAEFDESLNSVAAPVHDVDGGTVAAVHVQGPAFRFPADGESQAITELVMETAARLSGWLS